MKQNTQFLSQRWMISGLTALATLAFSLVLPQVLPQMVSQAQAASQRPFQTLLGSWKGSGTFSLQNGTRERISCNAYYTGGGALLGLAILCKSPNNEIHMRGKISYSGGHVSGSWEERTFHAEGKLTGKASDKSIIMDISGNVTGTMLVSFSDRKQKVTIKTTGTDLKSVSIQLAK